MSQNVLPPMKELLAEFDGGKVPRSDTWHTLITGLYFNFDSVSEIEGWYNTVQELTGFNQDLANKIQLNHDQIEIWYGQVDTWQKQVATNKLASENFANTATHQASLAYQWAANPENTPVAEGKFSSLHYARQSEEYAEASSANAYQTRQDSIDAENAKREALNSASAASISETHAADSAATAKASETASDASAKDAALSKVSASASENNAGSAASSALASRDSAASSASTATQQADRSESEADRSKSEADRAANSSSRVIGEICRFSLPVAPPGFFALDGSLIINGAIDYKPLINCGCLFIAVEGNNIRLFDQQHFGRGKGASGRAVGVYEGFQSTPYDEVKIVSNTYGKFIKGPINGAVAAPTVDTARNTIHKVNKNYRSEFETRPQSYTELVCLYHGVI